jgi:hypothetical protein
MDETEMNRIVAARSLGEQMIELQFGDGYVGRINLASALWGPVFEPLKDAEYFRQLRLEDDTVRWPNGAEFCPDVLRYWCENGGVRSQEETDAHFTQSPFEQATS